MTFAFELMIGSQPLELPDIHDRPAYAAHVSLGGFTLFTTAVSDPGGPYATQEMEQDVMRQFGQFLHDVFAEHTL